MGRTVLAETGYSLDREPDTPRLPEGESEPVFVSTGPVKLTVPDLLDAE